MVPAHKEGKTSLCERAMYMHSKGKAVKWCSYENAKLQQHITKDRKLSNKLYWSHGNNYINVSGFSHGFPLILVAAKVAFFYLKCLQDMDSGYWSYILISFAAGIMLMVNWSRFHTLSRFDLWWKEPRWIQRRYLALGTSFYY